jgi:hypothetical protein
LIDYVHDDNSDERVVPMSMFEIAIPQSVDLNAHYHRWMHRQVGIDFVCVRSFN